MPFIYTNPYREPYLAAKQELAQRYAELTAIQQRIQTLETMVAALGPLATTDDLPPLADNLPQLCSEVLMNSDRALTPLEVRHRLGLMGITIQGSNPMAILHTTLRRLADRPGSNVRYRTDQGGPAFEWIGLKPNTGFIFESKSLPQTPPITVTATKKKK